MKIIKPDVQFITPIGSPVVKSSPFSSTKLKKRP